MDRGVSGRVFDVGDLVGVGARPTDDRDPVAGGYVVEEGEGGGGGIGRGVGGSGVEMVVVIVSSWLGV